MFVFISMLKKGESAWEKNMRAYEKKECVKEKRKRKKQFSADQIVHYAVNENKKIG